MDKVTVMHTGKLVLMQKVSFISVGCGAKVPMSPVIMICVMQDLPTVEEHGQPRPARSIQYRSQLQRQNMHITFRKGLNLSIKCPCLRMFPEMFLLPVTGEKPAILFRNTSCFIIKIKIGKRRIRDLERQPLV